MKKFRLKKPFLLLLSAAVMTALVCCLPSCKAWRTVTTTATYTQQCDSAKGTTTTTISTKTVEDYQGQKK